MASNNYDWHLPETDIRDLGEIVTCDIEHLLEAVDSSSAQAGELDLYFRGPDYAKNGKKNRHQRHNYSWWWVNTQTATTSWQ